MNIRIIIAAVTAFFLLAPAAPARADIVLTPFVGTLFGGDLDDAKATYGASAAFMGARVIGAELSFTYSPTFVPQTAFGPRFSQASLMGNLIVGIPVGSDDGPSVRPYVTGGAGLFRTAADGDDFFNPVTSNDFALNFGGGVMAFFSEHVGIRGDVRFFRTIRDEEGGDGVDFELGDLNFWKWDIGAAFRF